jgi:hypothetical protein
MTTAPTTATAVDRLTTVTAMPNSTAEDRGRKVLAAASAVRNVNADLVSDHVRDLLSTNVWRDYVLPNGSRYQWRSQEFDYFLSAAGFDPKLVDHVIRGSGDRALLVAVAEATSDRQHADRRSLDDVTAIYPELAERLRARPLANPGVRKLINRPAAQVAYINGSGVEAASSPRSRWEVRWKGASNIDTAAAAIVGKLLTTPDLAEAVRALLHPAGR